MTIVVQFKRDSDNKWYSAELEGKSDVKQLLSLDAWCMDVQLYKDEIIVKNGALENFLGTVTGTLRVTSQHGDPLVQDRSIRVTDGGGHVVFLKPLTMHTPKSMLGWRDRIVDGIPSLISSEQMEALRGHWKLPSAPDDAGASGSAWLPRDGFSTTRAAAIQGVDVDGRFLRECERYIQEHGWDRDQHFYWGLQGQKIAGPLNAPGIEIGRYRKRGGVKPGQHGRTDWSEGKFPLDEQHHSTRQMLDIAALTGSASAFLDALHACEIPASWFEKYGTDFLGGYGKNDRTWAWPVLSWAETIEAFQHVGGGIHVDHLRGYINSMRARLENVRGSFQQGREPSFYTILSQPQNDHIGENATVIELAQTLGEPTSKVAKWWAPFMVSIGIRASLQASRVGYSAFWLDQAKRGLHQILVSARRAGYNYHTRALEKPMNTTDEKHPGKVSVRLAADVAPLARIYKSSSPNSVLGVGADFIVPALLQGAEAFPDKREECMVLVDEIVDYCDHWHWYGPGGKNGTKFMLEAWWRLWETHGWHGGVGS